MRVKSIHAPVFVMYIDRDKLPALQCPFLGQSVFKVKML